MRIYEKGEKVRLQDESIATVVEVRRGPYELPEGQNLGAPPGTVMGGDASYTVRNAKGKLVEVQDRDVRNPPKPATTAKATKSAGSTAKRAKKT